MKQKLKGAKMRRTPRLILMCAALVSLALPPAAFSAQSAQTDLDRGLEICRRLANDANPNDAKRAMRDFGHCYVTLRPYLEPGFVPATPARR